MTSVISFMALMFWMLWWTLWVVPWFLQGVATNAFYWISWVLVLLAAIALTGLGRGYEKEDKASSYALEGLRSGKILTLSDGTVAIAGCEHAGTEQEPGSTAT